jgi:tetratricopeptide (TPR) repeat protein
LFLDRAQASDPGFRITEHNAAAVRTLCARLEGIPLALELAAARVAVLTPAQMVEQLQHPFEFLINRSRDAEARHRSLEAAIDWSYRLLPSDLRRFFASLSVFRGGWSLEAATFLAQLDGQNDGAFDCLNALDALDALSRMRECSLIVASEAGREMRYRMLETLREYAAAHLTTDELNSLHLRHRRWCLALVSRLQGAPHGPGELERLAVLDREAENVWASLDWTRRTGLEVQSALQLAGEMGSFWYFRGYLRQARDAMAGLLACPGAEEPTLYRGWVLNTLGVMMSAQGDNAQAIPFFEEALQLGRRFNSGGTITHALSRLAAIHFRQGEIERAEARFSESLALKRAAGERLGVASNLASLGGIARIRGDYGRARALYKEGLQLAREMNDNRCEALVLDCLGRVARDEGELARSSSYHQEALAIRNSLGDRPGKVITCGNLALVALREARYDDAAALFEETLVISQEIGDRASIASCRWGEAHVALGKGDLQRAETLMRESLELRRNLEQPGDVLEALEGLALVTSRTRRAARAATLLAAVERHSELLGAVLPPHERVEHEDALRAVRELLGCDAYQAARDRGASLTLAQAVDLALDQSSLATGEG